MESKDQSQIRFWIRIETGHDSQLDGVDELKAELEEQGIPVQVSKPWHPSCSTGLECIFEIFANTTLADILISGIAYDVIKYGVIKIWNRLKTFAKSNRHDDFYPTIVIRLDDVKIEFNGAEYIDINKQTEILDRMVHHMRNLHKLGLWGIDRIEIPCPPCRLPDDIKDIDETKVWRVTYGAHDHVWYYTPSQGLI